MTTTTMPMLDTYPKEINLDRAKLAKTIDTLIACSEACTACADACLSGDMVGELTKRHPRRPRLRRHHRCRGACTVPPHRLRRQHHPHAAAGVRPGVQVLR